MMAVVALAAVLAPATSRAADRGHRGEQRAPTFSINSLSGKHLKLAKLKGNPIIVDFWATWCGPCRYAMPHLQTMQDRYGKDGLVVIGVSVDEIEPERVQRFVDRLGVKFPMAMATEEMLNDYGPIRVLPTTFFIDRDGWVVRRIVGYIDEETLDTYVKEFLH